jgi:hypothetical protein
MFDECYPDCCHLTLNLDWNSFCPASFVCHGNGSPNKILLVLHSRIGKCVSKLILASEVRMRCQVVFNSGHLQLHM